MHRAGWWRLFVTLMAAGELVMGAGGDDVYALRGGRIYTISHGVIEDGVVLIGGGKILDAGLSVKVPEGARVIDARGAVVTPGLIDARTSFGIGPDDSWERMDPVVPQVRIVDSFSLPGDHDWIKEGVTAVYVSPGPQNVIGGMGAVVKLAGRPDAIVVSNTAGMSLSLGEVPKASFRERAPRTRMGAAALIREAFSRARQRLEDAGAPPGADPGFAALGRVLRREVSARVQANTPDDIATALRLGEEFGFRVVIDIGVGAHLVADRLARAGVSVVVGPNMIAAGRGGRYEFSAHTEENAARLHEAGVKIAICTDRAEGAPVAMEAAISRAHGLPEAEALRAITMSAAEILGVADRMGSIDKGKDADLVVWTDHPLRTWSRVEKVFIDGRLAFDRSAAKRKA
ncbi:MAG: amidohydrolase family protein [Acidobacteria bacterium]|nr:amidohydrolase family protein [Acidobacteriota bacterium]